MKRWLATLQHFKMLLLYRLIQTVSYKTIFFTSRSSGIFTTAQSIKPASAAQLTSGHSTSNPKKSRQSGFWLEWRCCYKFKKIFRTLALFERGMNSRTILLNLTPLFVGYIHWAHVHTNVVKYTIFALPCTSVLGVFFKSDLSI